MTDLAERLAPFSATTSALEGDGGDLPPSDQEIMERPIVAPGSDALLPYAIEYQAPWDQLEDGLARHSRSQVRALSRAGLPVVLRRLSRPKFMLEDEVDTRVRASVGYLRDTSAASIPIAIRQLVIHNATFLENTVAPAGARMAGFENELNVYRSTIVYTPWERTTVAPAIVEVLNRCAETWVHGEWVVDIFRTAGVERVYAIPVAYDPDTSPASHISAPRGSESVPDGQRFYAIGKWEPRKNYTALLGAFLLEFSLKDKASLFLKTHEWGTWAGYPSISEALDKWLSDPAVQANGWTRANYRKRLRIVAKKLPEEEITKIHRENNIYVSCSHAEGWDLPAFEARCAGNRLVYTGWGGPTAFCSPNDVPLWAFLEPVHPGYGWEAGAEWASCPVVLLRDALRAARPPARRVHPPDFYQRFGLAPVGAMMAARLKERFPEAIRKLVLAGNFG